MWTVERNVAETKLKVRISNANRRTAYGNIGLWPTNCLAGPETQTGCTSTRTAGDDDNDDDNDNDTDD